MTTCVPDNRNTVFWEVSLLWDDAVIHAKDKKQSKLATQQRLVCGVVWKTNRRPDKRDGLPNAGTLCLRVLASITSHSSLVVAGDADVRSRRVTLHACRCPALFSLSSEHVCLGVCSNGNTHSISHSPSLTLTLSSAYRLTGSRSVGRRTDRRGTERRRESEEAGA